MAGRLPGFYTQKIPVSTQALVLGGAPLVFDIPRTSAIQRINVIVNGVIGTVAATGNIQGLSTLIQQVLLRGTVTGAAQFEPISGLSGPDMFEMAQFVESTLPLTTGSLTAAAAFAVHIPLIFHDPFFRGAQPSGQPNRILTAIPAFQMSGLTLTLTPATQAQVDVNVAPTFVLTNCNVTVEIEQYYPNTLPDNYNFIRSSYELSATDIAPPTANPRQLQIAAGGHYTHIVARSFSAANVKQSDLVSGPFTLPQGDIIIYDLNRFTKLETDFLRQRAANALQINGGYSALVAGNAGFLFNRSEHSVFQTSAIGTAQNVIQFNYNSTASAGSQIRIVSRRLFDPTNFLGIPLGQ